MRNADTGSRARRRACTRGRTRAARPRSAPRRRVSARSARPAGSLGDEDRDVPRAVQRPAVVREVVHDGAAEIRREIPLGRRAADAQRADDLATLEAIEVAFERLRPVLCAERKLDPGQAEQRPELLEMTAAVRDGDASPAGAKHAPNLGEPEIEL